MRSLRILGIVGAAAVLCGSTQVIRAPAPPSASQAADISKNSAAEGQQAENIDGYELYGESKPSLEIVGAAAGHPVSGVFQGLSLGKAILSIVPSGYKLYKKPDLNMEQPVYWKGKSLDWTVALGELVGNRNIHAKVDAVHKAVFLASSSGVSKLGGAAASKEVSAPPGAVSAPFGKPFQASGTLVPLKEALKGIVPDNYSVAILPPVDPSQPVSWSAQGGWREALKAIERSYNFEAAVNDEAKTINISSPWILNGGSTVRTEMMKWARAANWEVEWRLNSDWEIPNTAQFHGSFQSAVEQVVQALASQSVPVAVRFWDNHVVEFHRLGREG